MEANVETNMEIGLARSAEMTEPESEHRDPGETERRSMRRYEPIIGTLVVITDGHEPVVEFEATEGDARRRKALATVKIEHRAVGHPVEIVFVSGDLDRPVITKLAPSVDWQAELQVRWEALGRKALGIEPRGREIAALVEEVRVLACVAAWFATQGNITHAAENLCTSRRLLRRHVKAWQAQNPRVVPRRPTKERKPKSRRSKADAFQSTVEGLAPVTDGGSERGDGSMARDVDADAAESKVNAR